MSVRVGNKRRLWLRVLIGGLILWAATAAALWSTQDTTLVPSVIFIGSFLAPVTFAMWVYERETFSGASPDGQPSALTIPLLVTAFAAAGLFGVVVSALLETLLLGNLHWFFYLGVAVIEETVKLALVWILARNLSSYTLRDGMVLGACVGFGFAAFESAGYAFNVLLKVQSQDVLSILETQLVRGILTPVGHGLWTALLAGALFAAARNGKLRLTLSVVGWWFVVVALHYVWDASTSFSIALAYITTGTQVDWNDVASGKIADSTPALAHWVAIYSWVILTACAIVGIALANRMWAKGRAVVPGFPHGPAPQLPDDVLKRSGDTDPR